LKRPKVQSESVYQRTDITMTKRKVQKEKQWSTKHIYKAKGRVTGDQIKTGVNTGATEGYVYPDPLVSPVLLI
jgi:hypothetical protein